MFHVKQGISIIRPRPALPEFALTGVQACADVDPEIFYPERYSEESSKTAKRLCRSCPFLQECGVWAIKHDEREGIWGSLTPKERREIRNMVGVV